MGIVVTIWCTCYNHEKYISRCLDGFLKQQTNFDFEVVVHDDASTDNSRKIIEEYALKYPDIIKPIYETENQYSKKINLTQKFLLPYLKGKYVAFCEGDDFWLDENKLQMQYNILESYGSVDLCFHPVQIVDKNANLLKAQMLPNAKLLNSLHFNTGIIDKNNIMRILLNRRCEIHISSILLRADKLRELFTNPPEYVKSMWENRVGDICIATFFLTKGNFYFINKLMTCYRTGHDGTFSKSIAAPNRNNNLLKNLLKAWDKLYTEFDAYSNHQFHDIIFKKTVK